MATNPITSLPSNDFLPKAVHKLADAWRQADTRVKELQRQRRDAEGRIPAAQLQDAADFKSAVMAGGPLPAEDANERAVLAQVETIRKGMGIAEDARYRLGAELTVALREDSARGHLYAAVKEQLEPAQAAYLQALSDAESAVSAAYRTLVDATAGLAVLAALDSDKEVRVQPVAIGGLPNFTAAHAGVTHIATVLESLASRTLPQVLQRRLRLKGGRVVNVPRELAAGYVAAGQVDAFLDGFPPEPPAAVPANLPASFRPI